MKVLQYLWHYTLQKFGNGLLLMFTLLLNVRTWKTFHHISNLHQNIKFTMEGESNGELAFLDTLLKQNNGKISVLVYRKPTHTDQYLHYSSHHQTSCNESVVSSLYNKGYSIITNKDDLHKEKARIKQVLRRMDIRKASLVKSLRELLTVTACLSYSNKRRPQVSKSYPSSYRRYKQYHL